MLNVAHTLERMEISLTSPLRAVQQVREILGDDKMKNGAKLLKSILSMDVEFNDDCVALATCQAVVEALVKAEGDVGDEAELYAHALDRAIAHINNPEHSWMYFYEKDTPMAIATTTKAVEGTNASVEIKADGKIKRGGKQLIADALFKKHVLESETPCDNACFVKILMKEAGMSLPGARTYAHSLRAKNGMVTSRPAK